MGTIKFPKHNDLRKSFNEIPITNWRTLGDLDNDQVQVVIARFHRFIIEDMTIEYFHRMNKYRFIDVRRFQYINSAAACCICHGAGKVDWIQKARPEGIPVIDIKKNYWRDKDVVNHLSSLGYQVNELYGSQPKLYEGQELCGRCKGTGMESIKGSQFLPE